MYKYVDTVVIVCVFLGVVFMLRRHQKKEEAIVELKESFLFEINEFKDLIIQAVSGDQDNLNFWIKSWVDDLALADINYPEKPAWYVLTRSALRNTAYEYFDIAQRLIKEGNYYHAVGILEKSNEEILAYEVVAK